MSDEQAGCRIRPNGCPSPREMELLRHALAMDAALRTVRLYAEAAEAGGGMVPSDMIMRALNEPYRFPLPGEAEALGAYRKVFELGDRTISHLADCSRCNPIGYDHDYCAGYVAAFDADVTEAHRVRGGWPPWSPVKG